MINVEPAARALDELERIQNDLARIAERLDDGRRNELVQLRREAGAATTRLVQLTEPLFADAPADLAEFKRLYSAMRSAIAAHQADWPAVRLNDIDGQYLQSAQNLRTANTAFLNWLRGRLRALKR